MLDYQFMRIAFLAAAIVAIFAGAVGYFLVMRSQTFAGHALSHVGFAGAAGSVLLGLSPLWGLAAFTLASGVGMGLLGDRLRGRDVAVGVILAFSLGLGVLFLHFYTKGAGATNALLFGNIFAVDRHTMWLLLAAAIASLAALGVVARPLVHVTLQPELAEAKGVSPRLLSVLFLVIVAIAVVESVQIVGILLVFALMVGPGAAAARLAGSVVGGTVVAILIALGAAWIGIVLAFYTDWPVSSWITGLSTAAYLATLAPVRRRRPPAIDRDTHHHHHPAA
jgi:zinc/manganese transport system permease protein